QVNTTYLLTDELAKMLTVKKAEEPEKEQKKEEAEEDEETTQTARKYVSFSRLEEIALSNFLKTEGLHQLPLIRDAKFFIHFHQIDPISEYSPIFDGYIKTLDTEIFIEMKPIGRINPSYIRDRVYLMLSKINYYRTIKKINAYLFLVFVAKPDDEKNKSMIERIYKEFEPAISNGLLEVRTVNISQQEYNSINETE
ncbi:MAG: hypothetical protein IT279_08840, partial [Ignavibacteriaceae bacterium]|nr:hypothetical protein [Ignavibacteriaceae bacterium]